MAQVTLSNTKELWQISFDWITLCGNKVNKNYCKEEISTHPDYPALTSVVDLLDSGGMAYRAIRADASYIHEFNYPALAHIKQPGREYMHIIPTAADWDNQIDITQHWTGVVLFPEKNTSWQNEQNRLYQDAALKNRIITAVLVIMGIAIFAFSTFQLLQNTALSFGGFASVFGLLSLIGLIVSVFALGTELGFQSQVVKQVCGAVSNGGCEKVLKSSYAKGIAGITPADASLLYFAAQYVMYLLGCWYPFLLPGILLLAFAGVLVTIWSIYTQAVKLKQWCALCLAIAAVLTLQAIIGFTVFTGTIDYPVFAGFGLLLLTFALILFPVKELVKTNSSNKLKLAELKKWKLDAGLFISQWEQEQTIDATVWPNDLLLGNPDAALLITVACNPYCGPCAKAHKQLDDLLHRYSNKLKVQVRLLCNAENEMDDRTVATKAILQKASVLKDNQQLQSTLTDWFEWMDYNKWVKKWQPDNTIDVNERMLQHSQWVQQSDIAFTPTFFVNGKKLPGRYSLNDLEILIPQLAEQITV